MKRDKSIDDLHDKVELESNTAATDSNDDKFRIDKYDDEYYLDQNRDPPRFLLYRQARAEKWEESGPHAPSDYDDTVTQDELDYALKRRLRITPEQRYQDEKRHYYFHELYVEGGPECNPARDGCIPGHCRFADEYGVITDEDVIEDHNKNVVEYYRQNNKIVEPPSEVEMQRLANAYRFDLI